MTICTFMAFNTMHVLIKRKSPSRKCSEESVWWQHSVFARTFNLKQLHTCLSTSLFPLHDYRKRFLPSVIHLCPFSVSPASSSWSYQLSRLKLFLATEKENKQTKKKRVNRISPYRRGCGTRVDPILSLVSGYSVDFTIQV